MLTRVISAGLAMKLKILLFIGLGLALSVLAGLGTYRYARSLEKQLAQVERSLSAFGDLQNVPVLRSDKPAGSRLERGDFGFLPLPRQYVPSTALTALPDDLAQGVVTLAALRAGAVLLQSDIAFGNSDAKSSFLLSGDARALAVSVENLTDYQGLLRRDERVDLIWSARGIGGGSETRLIASSLRILALPPLTGGPDQALGGKIILETGARQAFLSIDAAADGRFYILPAGRKLAETDDEYHIGPQDLVQLPVVVRYVEGEAAAPSADVIVPAVAKAEVKCRTAVIRGAARSESEVPC